MKPRIDREAMKSIIVKVGQSCEYDVPVSGEPPPKCTWSFGDKPLVEDGSVKIDNNEDYLTHLRFYNVTRAMHGKYLLKAVNGSGEDSCETELIVHGKASAPEGPLAVSDVYEDHCTLDWKPPLDDGGLNIDHVGEDVCIFPFDICSTKWRRWMRRLAAGCRAAAPTARRCRCRTCCPVMSINSVCAP